MAQTKQKDRRVRASSKRAHALMAQVVRCTMDFFQHSYVGRRLHIYQAMQVLQKARWWLCNRYM